MNLGWLDRVSDGGGGGGGGGYINSTGVLQEQQRNLCMRIEETPVCVDIDPTAPITQVNWTFIYV